MHFTSALSLFLSVSLCLCVSVSLSLCLSISVFCTLFHSCSLAHALSLFLFHTQTRVCARTLLLSTSLAVCLQNNPLSLTHTQTTTQQILLSLSLFLSAFCLTKKIWKTSTYSLVVKRHKEGVSNFKYEETIQEYVEFNCWCPARVQGK